MSLKFKNHKACVVGSRNITQQDKDRIFIIGNLLANLGIEGVSGNAIGNDKEWDKYICVQHFLPWNGYNGGNHGRNNNQYLSLDYCPESSYLKAEAIMEDHHPNGASLRQGARKMHVRNVFQVLGVYLDERSQVDLTIYCADETPTGKVSGGTATAVAISRTYGIPTFNLRIDEQYEQIRTLLSNMIDF